MEYPIIHTMEQGSDEWFAAKLGKVSTSVFSIATAGGSGKTRQDLLDDLIEERITRKPKVGISTPDMLRGRELEPYARADYEVFNDCKVEQIGFLEYTEYIGSSPDGLIGPKRGLEIKCPRPKTHIKYIKGKLSKANIYQVQGSLWLFDRDEWDFVSYCPEAVEKPYCCIRFARDIKIIAEIEVKITQFADELKREWESIKNPEF